MRVRRFTSVVFTWTPINTSQKISFPLAGGWNLITGKIQETHKLDMPRWTYTWLYRPKVMLLHGFHLPWLESWAAWERIVVILKADGPAVRILWSIDCNEACVTAAVRTVDDQTETLLACVCTYIFELICSTATRMVSALQHSKFFSKICPVALGLNNIYELCNCVRTQSISVMCPNNLSQTLIWTCISSCYFALI